MCLTVRIHLRYVKKYVQFDGYISNREKVMLINHSSSLENKTLTSRIDKITLKNAKRACGLTVRKSGAIIFFLVESV